MKKHDHPYLRFQVSSRDNKEIHRALNVARVICWEQPEFVRHGWKGLALAHIASWFFRHANPIAVKCAEEQERELRAAKKDHRFGSVMRMKVMRDVYDRYFKKPETEELVFLGQIPDSGRLREAITVSLARYVSKCRHRGREGYDFAIAEYKPETAFCLARWSDPDEGGFLLRIRGDSRTATDAGGRPTVYVWMENEISGWDPQRDYETLFEMFLARPILEVVECVPMGVEVDWDPPKIATGRIEVNDG